MIKYALHPGFVTSRSDGDEHFISSEQLRFLFHLPAEECITVDPDFYGRYFKGVNLWKKAHVYPRYNGDYETARENLKKRIEELKEKYGNFIYDVRTVR